MKTQLIIEIETNPKNIVCEYDEVGNKVEWDELDKQEKFNLNDKYKSELHRRILAKILDVVKQRDDDTLFDTLEELYIDGYDDLEDYGVKITTAFYEL